MLRDQDNAAIRFKCHINTIPLFFQNFLFAVHSEHAKIEYKSGRLFLTALYAADPDNILSSTATWLEGTELRLGVNYMVAPGSKLTFGTADGNALVAEFEEGGGAGGLADMLMKGMASQASKEVQEKLQGLN